ncbi:MAG: PEP-CTERM sorting domain-containing protein [Opitutales bacterium]
MRASDELFESETPTSWTFGRSFTSNSKYSNSHESIHQMNIKPLICTAAICGLASTVSAQTELTFISGGSGSSQTSTISYSSVDGFATSNASTTLGGSFASSVDFSFDVTVTAYDNITIDGSSLNLNDSEATLNFRNDGWAVIGGANGNRINVGEALLITFDSFVGISSVEMTELGSRAWLNGDDAGLFLTSNSNTAIGSDLIGTVSNGTDNQFTISETVSEGTTYLFTAIDGAGLRLEDLSFSSVVAAVPEPSTYALLFGGAIALGTIAVRRRRK